MSKIISHHLLFLFILLLSSGCMANKKVEDKEANITLVSNISHSNISFKSPPATPEEAYWRYIEALENGSINQIRRLLTIEEFNRIRNPKLARQGFELYWKLHPREIVIVKSGEKENFTFLYLRGVNFRGGAMKGEVKLMQEGNLWKIVRERWEEVNESEEEEILDVDKLWRLHEICKGYKTVAQCDEVKGEIRKYLCYHCLARKKKQIKFCYLIPRIGEVNRILRDNCIMDVAFVKHKLKLCNSILSPYKRDLCLKQGKKVDYSVQVRSE